MEEDIHIFFASFLDEIMEELNHKPYNSIYVNKKMNAFSDFTHKYEDELINNEYLRNYSTLFDLNAHNHNFCNNSVYVKMDDYEKNKSKQTGSRLKFPNISPESGVHESYDFIKNRILPSIEKFFCLKIHLFNELKNEFNQIN